MTIKQCSAQSFSDDVKELKARDQLTYMRVDKLLEYYKGKWKSKDEDIVIFEDGSKAELNRTTCLFKVIE